MRMPSDMRHKPITRNPAMARATRDLRYYGARRASAQLVETDAGDPAVQFGSRVTFDREDGRRQSFRIVGEDEADPARGAVSYASPLAEAPGGEIEIVQID